MKRKLGKPSEIGLAESSWLNENMTLSAICCTFGRTARLQEALACFLNQDYAKKELVIFNSFPRQTLVFDHPQVRIINCKNRPPSLGACRNMAIEASTGDAWVVWDDDDLYLPHHLRTYSEAFKQTGADWVRVRPEYYAVSWIIKQHTTTAPNAVAVRKAAWKKVGGYPDDLSVGEDQKLFRKLSEQCSGATVDLNPDDMSLIMCWGNSVYHVSGKGDDGRDRLPAYERSRQELETRVAQKQEPVGTITLVPKLTNDPVMMRKDYFARHPSRIRTSTPGKPPICVVELGRYGDIINILPILLRIHNTYDTPYLMVSREFADLLEGVSYVKPLVVDLKNDQINEAMALAHKQFKHVIRSQIWGTKFWEQRLTKSYNKESWRVAGFLHKFDDRTWRPVFDRQNKDRARATATKMRHHPEKPLILVNVTQSISSPFPYGKFLLNAITQRWSKQYEVVDIGGLKLERIYDLIVPMEQAAAVVSIDTALLHLAAATNTPTVALVNHGEWVGSIPRAEAFTTSYNVAQKTPDIMNELIEKAINSPRVPMRCVMPVPSAKRRIFHVCERHEDPTPQNLKDVARKNFAQASWDVLYAKGVVPCHYWDYKRTAHDIGDKRALPYLKDVLKFGMDQAGDEDIIMWTNDDNWLHPELPEIVTIHCSLWDVCCSQRCEFNSTSGPIGVGKTPEWYAAKGQKHMGRDLFAFTKRWLLQQWSSFPDFILGASDFDLALACMVRLEWGVKTSRQNIEDSIWPCELPRGYIAHEFHPPKWCEPKTVNTAPAQIHNRKMFKAWAGKHLPSLVFHSPHNVI